MEMRAGPATEHVDFERLGVYLDGRASSLEREQVELHLSVCPDCYELFVDSAEALTARTDVEPAGATVPVPGSRTRQSGGGESDRHERAPSRRWMWIGLLPAAAALALATWIGMETLRPGARETAEFQTLISAMAAGRPVEGRLSGGVPYGPPPSTFRSGAASGPRSPRVDAAAASIQSSLEQDRSAEAQGALGISYLAVGVIDRAISAFEAAAAAEPERAAVHNDLAVAYLQRARIAGSKADLTRALEAVERALGIDPGMPEARFNRALALERLERNDAAIAAWKAYVAADATSEWAAEARRALAALEARAR